MATFRLQVFYQRAINEKWSNVWHADADVIGDLVPTVTEIFAPGLLPLLDTSCELVKVLISDPASTDFVEVPIGSPGTSTGSGDLLPLFNCAKALIQTAALGRPDYKFFKGFVTESIQTQGILTSGASGAVASAVNDLITAMTDASHALVSESGDLWAVATCQDAVQMRQMHRKRRRSP